MKAYNSLLLTALSLPGVLSNFLGPIYPAPNDITSSKSLVAAAWQNLTTILDQSFHNHRNSTQSRALNDLTFSVGLFSTRDSHAERLQYHHAAPEIRNASVGTRTIDGNSIYRIASVSKLFTRPLTEVFPEFSQFIREKSNTLDPVYDTQWDAITPSALASQMGGIAQYAAPWYTDYLSVPLIFNLTSPATDPATYGLPPVNQSDPANWAPCATREGMLLGVCDAESYAAGASTNPPIALPWTSPIYSNNGFTLLGMAIANLTGKPIEEVYQQSIFDPLEMSSSYSLVPPNSSLPRSVIAGSLADFAITSGLSTSSGGIYSTLNDLAKFSTAILNSTLLDIHKTHRWMKPVTHTSDLHYSIGAPWEIYRYEHPATGLVTDIYTKLGDSGNYGAMTLFLPDFDAGFNVITASSNATRRSPQTLYLVQQVTDVILPALTEQGSRELEQKYAGTYTSTVENLNSTITFSASDPSDGPPGLTITSWISNGTDVLTPLIANGLLPAPVRLRPLISPPASGPGPESRQIVFRPATEPTDPVLPRDPSNLFTSFYDADQFAALGQATYAGQYFSQFVFHLSDEAGGEVEGVTPSAWRLRLEKLR
ncbi:beta-lactamase/transpeptidase-like protein [Aspergillus recurvatus]